MVDMVGIAAMVAAVVFYHDQPIYILVFAAISMVVALLAKLVAFSRSSYLTARMFATLWAVMLAVVVVAELGVRYARRDVHGGGQGAIPVAIAWLSGSHARTESASKATPLDSLSSKVDSDSAANARVMLTMATLLNAQRCMLDRMDQQADAIGWTQVLNRYDPHDRTSYWRERSKLVNYYKIKRDEIDTMQSYRRQGDTIIALLDPSVRDRAMRIFASSEQVWITALQDLTEAQRRENVTLGSLLELAYRVDLRWPKMSQDYVSAEWKHQSDNLTAQRAAYPAFADYQAKRITQANEPLNGFIHQAYPQVTLHGADCLASLPTHL